MSSFTPSGTPRAAFRGNCASGSPASVARLAVREKLGLPPECCPLFPVYCCRRDSTWEAVCSGKGP
eukprot:9622631-Lingulodinium_polyedra.AAC.1